MEENDFFDGAAYSQERRKQESERRQQMINEQLMRLVQLANHCGQDFRDKLTNDLEETLESNPLNQDEVMGYYVNQYN